MAEISTEFGSVENRTFFAGTEVSPLTTSVTLAGGQDLLKKGAVLSKDGGSYKLAGDGDEASLILAESVDTTDGDIEAVAYTRGLFNADALTVADGSTVEGHIAELRKYSIYVKTDYPAVTDAANGDNGDDGDGQENGQEGEE